jgi:hypothetical protein
MDANHVGGRKSVGVPAVGPAMSRDNVDATVSSLGSQARQASRARPRPEWMADYINVKRFGAVGNRTADDTDAIQAAVDWTSGFNRGTIYFPRGIYRITSSINFNRRDLNIRFRGEPGAKIIGNFNDFLFKRRPNSKDGGFHSVEYLQLINRHARGRGIAFHNCARGKIANCYISAWRGVEAYSSQSMLVDSCTIIGPAGRSSVGIVAGDATTIISTRISEYDHGIRHQKKGLLVYGGRMEANTTAVVVGMDETGNDTRSTGFNIAGVSIVSNRTGIHVASGAGGAIRAISIGGNVRMKYGLLLGSCQDVLVEGVTVRGSHGYTGAGIAVERARRTVFMSVRSVSPTRWSIGGRRSQLTFIQTDRP